MSLIGTTLFMSALATTASPVPPADLPEALRVAVRAFDEAQVNADKAELERLIAEDYLLVNSRGQRESKSKLIADYTAPGFRLEPFRIEQPVTMAWQGGAVLGGVTTLRGVADGKAFEVRLRFSDVWALRDGRWQLIYTAASREE